MESRVPYDPSRSSIDELVCTRNDRRPNVNIGTVDTYGPRVCVSLARTPFPYCHPEKKDRQINGDTVGGETERKIRKVVISRN